MLIIPRAHSAIRGFVLDRSLAEAVRDYSSIFTEVRKGETCGYLFFNRETSGEDPSLMYVFGSNNGKGTVSVDRPVGVVAVSYSKERTEELLDQLAGKTGMETSNFLIFPGPSRYRERLEQQIRRFFVDFFYIEDKSWRKFNHIFN